VRLTEDRDLKRRRLGVLFRPLLVVPVAVVAAAWLLIALAVLPVAWVGALLSGRVPFLLHRTIAAALDYSVQVDAWVTLVSRLYPWPWRRRLHPVRVEAKREHQRRWTVLIRIPLAVPAIVLASVLAVVHGCTTLGAWVVGLVLGRTTEGLRELGAFCLRYAVETAAYLLLVTPEYPTLAPRLSEEPAAEPS
jgi:Domain of unknown function (DUF4389)